MLYISYFTCYVKYTVRMLRYYTIQYNAHAQHRIAIVSVTVAVVQFYNTVIVCELICTNTPAFLHSLPLLVFASYPPASCVWPPSHAVVCARRQHRVGVAHHPIPSSLPNTYCHRTYALQCLHFTMLYMYSAVTLQ